MQNNKIPIIILTRERPLQLQAMINSIEKYTEIDTYEIILCDNDSQQPEMIYLLKEFEKKYTVIYNKKNLIFAGFNPGLKLVKSDYFILSDPDIILNKNIPKNWIEIFIKFFKKYPLAKIGFALDITKLPHPDIPQSYKIKRWEKQFNENLFEQDIVLDKCYVAKIATTFAMYRKDSFVYWEDGLKVGHPTDSSYFSQKFFNKKYNYPSIRVAGRFKSEHAGWFMLTDYKSDFDYYKNRTDNLPNATSTNLFTNKPSFYDRFDENKI